MTPSTDIPAGIAHGRKYAGLKPTDREILALLAMGFGEPEAATLLGRSLPAVRNIIRRCRAALEADSAAQLICMAIDQGQLLPLSMDRRLSLSSEDRNIVELISLGYSDRQIAKYLQVTKGSFRITIRKLFDRTGAFNRNNLVALWASEEYYDDAYFSDLAERRSKRDERYRRHCGGGSLQ